MTHCTSESPLAANLNRIRIVLVSPSHPGNIGSTARAMKNMGLRHLALVAPKAFPHPEAVAMASGADDVLTTARVFPSLPAAVADCTLVLATSGRVRHMQRAEYEPREAAWALMERAGQGNMVAVVFGAERAGLTNEELDVCHAQVKIPCDSEFCSLNLSQAVLILAYELRLLAHFPGFLRKTPNQRPATGEEMERLYEHMEDVLHQAGFLDANNAQRMMSRLRMLVDRTVPDVNEVNIMRGVLTEVERWGTGSIPPNKNKPEKE